MKDHGLFQAICRVNRLDGEDKEFGQIIDYKDLFKSIDKSITDYTSDAFDGFEDDDIPDLVTDRLEKAKKKLNDSLENVSALCEPVKSPKDTQDFIDYFAPEELDETAPRREALYKMSASLIRAYSTLANDMPEAGYSKKEAQNLQEKARYFTKVRDEIKLASGDHIDLKAYEPSMRYMIDTYISADESEKISSFEDLTLVEMIVQNGTMDTIDKMPKNIRKNKGTVAEVIENNIRKIITEEKPTNPKFFDRMSILLREIIKQRKEDVISYEEYLKKISDFCNKVKGQSSDIKLPESLNTKAKRVLYENLDNNESLTLAVDEAILSNKPDGWRGNKIKEKKVLLAIKEALRNNNIDDDELAKTILELARRQNDY